MAAKGSVSFDPGRALQPSKIPMESKARPVEMEAPASPKPHKPSELEMRVEMLRPPQKVGIDITTPITPPEMDSPRSALVEHTEGSMPAIVTPPASPNKAMLDVATHSQNNALAISKKGGNRPQVGNDFQQGKPSNAPDLHALLRWHRIRLQKVVDQTMDELEAAARHTSSQDLHDLQRQKSPQMQESLSNFRLEEAVSRFMVEEAAIDRKINPKACEFALNEKPEATQCSGSRPDSSCASAKGRDLVHVLPMISEEMSLGQRQLSSGTQHSELSDRHSPHQRFSEWSEDPTVSENFDETYTASNVVGEQPSFQAANTANTGQVGFLQSITIGLRRLSPTTRAQEVGDRRYFMSSFSDEAVADPVSDNVIKKKVAKPSKHARIDNIKAQRDAAMSEKWYSKNVLERWVTHPAFESASCVLILVNTVMNGAEVEMMVHGNASDVPFETLQHIFTILFAVELVLRLLAFRSRFCWGEDWAWNLFDTIVVLVGVAEMFVTMFAGDDNFVDTTSQRMLRTIRVVRNLRIVRMLRFFYELRQMLLAVFGSMKTLMWLFILMTMMLYFFSLCLTSAVYDFLTSPEGQDDPDADLLRFEFGSILKTGLSLFKAITNGVSWGVIMDSLSKTGWAITVLYVGYIVFAVFAFMNAVTSVFVDNSMRATQSQQEQRIHRELEVKEETERHLEQIFNDVDIDGSNKITEDELEAYLEDQRASAYFSTLGLGRPDASVLFKLFDTDGSGELDIDEFVTGCLRMKGEAKSIEIAELRKETNKILRRLTRFMSYTHATLDGIKAMCNDTFKHLGGVPIASTEPPKRRTQSSVKKP